MLVAVVCSEAAAALLARHRDFLVVWTAPNGTGRPAVDAAPVAGEGECMTPPPLLLDLPQVADALHLSERKVRSMVASGELTAVNVGRARRVRASDLAEFVERLGASTTEGNPMTNLARLERNAQLYRGPDAQLDPIADAMDAGDTEAWRNLPALLVDMASNYRDARAAHRRAVEAGAITEDGTSLLA